MRESVCEQAGIGESGRFFNSFSERRIDCADDAAPGPTGMLMYSSASVPGCHRNRGGRGLGSERAGAGPIQRCYGFSAVLILGRFSEEEGMHKPHGAGCMTLSNQEFGRGLD